MGEAPKRESFLRGQALEITSSRVARVSAAEEDRRVRVCSQIQALLNLRLWESQGTVEDLDLLISILGLDETKAKFDKVKQREGVDPVS